MIPNDPDGNCGFSAIQTFLALSRQALPTEINRMNFIELVRGFGYPSTDEVMDGFIHEMLGVDQCASLDEWFGKFRSSSKWADEVHFKILSRHFGFIIRVYAYSQDQAAMF